MVLHAVTNSFILTWFYSEGAEQFAGSLLGPQPQNVSWNVTKRSLICRMLVSASGAECTVTDMQNVGICLRSRMCGYRYAECWSLLQEQNVRLQICRMLVSASGAECAVTDMQNVGICSRSRMCGYRTLRALNSTLLLCCTRYMYYSDNKEVPYEY
jgi:hypothetical protein